MVFPAVDAVGEPHSNLALSALHSITSVADVTPDMEAEVTTDSTRVGRKRLGLAEHLAASLDCVKALPDHAADGSAGHVLDKAGEELLLLEISVVVLEKFTGWCLELQGLELEATVFEALDDLSDKTTLDAVGLHHDVGALLVCTLGFGHF